MLLLFYLTCLIFLCMLTQVNQDVFLERCNTHYQFFKWCIRWHRLAMIKKILICSVQKRSIRSITEQSTWHRSFKIWLDVWSLMLRMLEWFFLSAHYEARKQTLYHSHFVFWGDVNTVGVVSGTDYILEEKNGLCTATAASERKQGWASTFLSTGATCHNFQQQCKLLIVQLTIIWPLRFTFVWNIEAFITDGWTN